MTYREKFIIQDGLEEMIPSENAYVQRYYSLATVNAPVQGESHLMTALKTKSFEAKTS